MFAQCVLGFSFPIQMSDDKMPSRRLLFLRKAAMTKWRLRYICLVQLAAIACAASAQGPYPGDGDLLDPEHGYPYSEERIYQLAYPPEIFDYCVELYGIGGSRAEQCMRYENQQMREAETLLQGEVGNPQVRERICAK